MGTTCFWDFPAGSFLVSVVIENSPYTASTIRVVTTDSGSHLGDAPFSDTWVLQATAEDLFWVLVFFDDTGTRSFGGDFFVNESLEGWTAGTLSIDVEVVSGPSGPLARLAERRTSETSPEGLQRGTRPQPGVGVPLRGEVSGPWHVGAAGSSRA